MKNRPGTRLQAFLLGLLAYSSTGCSLLFVNAPPSPRAGGMVRPTADCSTSQVAPVLDTIFGGLEVARVVYAGSADDSVYENPSQPLSRGADVALGLGFTALFVGSALYGYKATSDCRKRQHEDEQVLAQEREQERDFQQGHRRNDPPPVASAPAPPAPPEAPESAEAATPAGAADAGGAPSTGDAAAPSAP